VLLFINIYEFQTTPTLYYAGKNPLPFNPRRKREVQRSRCGGNKHYPVQNYANCKPRLQLRFLSPKGKKMSKRKAPQGEFP